MHKELDIIIPISMGNDWQTEESIVHDILEQNRQYGFTKFALTTPGHVFRRLGYPSKEHYAELAQRFLRIKEHVMPYGITCGWWIALTFKSGASKEFQSMVKSDGSEHPFANCPLDSAFIRRFTNDVAEFAATAKPAFIITEDDFSLSAAAGCYCDLHINEFNKRYRYSFTREQLVEVLEKRTPEALEIIQQWRELAKDSQVEFAAAMRKALDEQSPEIPMGYLQASLADTDGDCTYAIAKAMAGDRHVPFSRLFGASYGGIVSRELPQLLFHMLYSKQHITQEFLHYMEADTFPHTRFFSAGCQMLSAMAVVFSYGFDGALFIVRQLLDGGNEETAYSKGYAKERKRFEALHQALCNCELKGVNVHYDPFYSTLDDDPWWSWWTQPVGRFGIPYVTTDSPISFWDDRVARYADDKEIRQALSKVLVLDGASAKALCERGYGQYLGVDVGDDVKQGMLQWDLATREVIVDDYVGTLPGRNMTAPWMLAPKGNGWMPKLTITDPACRVITELYNGEKELLTPAMTKYQNTLGGTVIVMGLTVKNNGSQALFNYRRKHLLQTLVAECCDDFCLVKQAPDVMIIENQATDPACGFKEILTLVNMCADALDTVALHLPERLKGCSVEYLDADGTWKPITVTPTADGIELAYRLDYCAPCYLLLK
ncbi:MAG: hypothetical protein IJP14_07160 [Clostridia bacterium]|nr:hypothetical protein [Clostridia bacterium]